MKQPKTLVFDLSGTLVDSRDTLYAGAKEFLEAALAADYQLAVATNLGHESMVATLKENNIQDLFIECQSASRSGFKPAPDMLHNIAELTGISCQDMLMIGDSEGDLLMARHAKAQSCAALWGQGRKDILKPLAPNFIAETFADLAKLLEIRTEV